MIGNVREFVDQNSLIINWKTPEILPDMYMIDMQCRYPCSFVPYLDTGPVRLPSTTTYHNFFPLHPGSQCSYTFTSVYNPATRDCGISSVVHTSDSSECTSFNPQIICILSIYLLFLNCINYITKRQSVKAIFHLFSKQILFNLVWWYIYYFHVDMEHIAYNLMLL